MYRHLFQALFQNFRLTLVISMSLIKVSVEFNSLAFFIHIIVKVVIDMFLRCCISQHNEAKDDFHLSCYQRLTNWIERDADERFINSTEGVF